MIILGFIGPQEIALLLILIIVGAYIYFIIRSNRDIRRIGGSSRLKVTKWILIILTILISYISVGLNILGSFSLLILIAGLGAIVGIARYKPSTKLKIKNKDNQNLRNV